MRLIVWYSLIATGTSFETLICTALFSHALCFIKESEDLYSALLHNLTWRIFTEFFPRGFQCFIFFLFYMSLLVYQMELYFQHSASHVASYLYTWHFPLMIRPYDGFCTIDPQRPTIPSRAMSQKCKSVYR